jgi:hypothetical protein
MVTSATTKILAIIISFGGASLGGVESLARASQRLGELLTEYAAAKNVETKII